MVSSSVRNPNTPGVSVLSSTHMPSIGGKNVRLPVATISLSYGETVPSSANTLRANRSTRTTRTPACSVMSLSAYQSSGLR